MKSMSLAIVCLSLAFFCLSAFGEAPSTAIRVVVWDEQQPAQKSVYPNFLGNYIAEQLKGKPGLAIRSVNLGSPEQGLSTDVLEDCDVLIWWGHVRHREIKPEKGREIVGRIKAGKLSLITLHSAHWSTPFVEAMYERTRIDALGQVPAADRGKVKLKEIYSPLAAPKADSPLTPSTSVRQLAGGTREITLTHANCCFPVYRVEGKPSHVKTLLPDHPIARGVPAAFDIPQTELYGAPFHVPKPDAVIFQEKWETGETFPSGVWKLGEGRIFYFRPGHETYPIFKQAEVMKVLENAVRWLGAKPRPPR